MIADPNISLEDTLSRRESIGDVRNFFREMDMDGTYMIIKLKNPNEEFVYDNTEMVVRECYFDGSVPGQFHLGIMRNPTDMILNKFKKVIYQDKLDIMKEFPIIELSYEKKI